MPGRSHVVVPGSRRKRVETATPVGAPHPGESLDAMVLLRSRASGPSLRRDVRALASRLPHERRHLEREEFERHHGVHDRDLKRVARVAKQYGLDVHEDDTTQASGLLTLGGDVAAMERMFGVELCLFEHRDAVRRAHRGSARVPSALDGIVDGVFGLDAWPVVRGRVGPAAQAPPVLPFGERYSGAELASLYDFPGGDGSGQCIALIELGGGYVEADLQTYFASIKVPVPQIIPVPVGTGKNAPTGKWWIDGEVVMDIEVTGSIVPKAKLAIYFADDSNKGLIQALAAAIHDRTNRPSIIGISWGSDESTDWTASERGAVERALQAAARMGITVLAAAGDHGSHANAGDPDKTVNFPASSAFALACGGTDLTSSKGKVKSEVVWSVPKHGYGSGGGVSVLVPLPSYQGGANVGGAAKVPKGTRVGRGLPDVAANAVGYLLRIDGANRPGGGTSAVVPLIGALIARVNQALGTNVGFINRLLYTRATGSFRPIVKGTNGAYQAGPGWNPCAGLGAPNGKALLEALGPPSRKS